MLCAQWGEGFDQQGNIIRMVSNEDGSISENEPSCARCQARNPAKDMPIGIIGATSICTILYIIMCIVICMMVPYADIDISAPFSTAFGQVGMQWAK